jgi:hypothetical protein
MASVVGGIGVTSILPLILATILAYCVTGYVRDELYHPFVKTCVGPGCNILVRGTLDHGGPRAGGWRLVLLYVF